MKKHDLIRKMEEKTFQYIEQHKMICAHEKILIGVSGGADSVCLLFLLIFLREKLKIELEVVHVNHGLRESAKRDEEYVCRLCDEQRIPVHVACVDVAGYVAKKGLGIEEAARIVRYEAFENIKTEIGASKIAVAHHVQDQAETMLFHLCRGTGLDGLCGMKPVRDDIIRPILPLSKEDILAYLQAKGVSYVMDETNLDNSYARNSLRNEVFPLLEKKITKNSTVHMAKTAEMLSGAQDYIASQIEAEMQKCVCHVSAKTLEINLIKWKELHPYLQQEIIRKTIFLLSDNKKDITAKHIQDVNSLCKKQVGSRINLPYHIQAKRDYDLIRLTVIDEKTKNCNVLQLGTVEYEAENIVLLNKSDGYVGLEKIIDLKSGKMIKIRLFENQKDRNIPTKPYTKWFDYDKIKTSLSFRKVQMEDYFFFDDTRKKLVKDYMKDEKISFEKRGESYIIAEGSHMLYFVGKRISNYYKISDNTSRILEIEFCQKGEGEKNGRDN